MHIGQDLVGVDGDSSAIYLVLSGDGTTLAVATPIANRYAGKVSVYTYDSTNGEWKPKGEDIMGERQYDTTIFKFGTHLIISACVSLNDDGMILVMGSPGNDRGQAQVFKWNITAEAWETMGDKVIGSNIGDRFGVAVALSGSGLFLAVGAHQKKDSNNMEAGQVKVFQWDNGNIAWKQIGQDVVGETTDKWFGCCSSRYFYQWCLLRDCLGLQI